LKIISGERSLRIERSSVILLIHLLLTFANIFLCSIFSDINMFFVLQTMFIIIDIFWITDTLAKFCRKQLPIILVPLTTLYFYAYNMLTEVTETGTSFYEYFANWINIGVTSSRLSNFDTALK